MYAEKENNTKAIHGSTEVATQSGTTEQALTTPNTVVVANSYFKTRMDELGITGRTNSVTVELDCYDDAIPQRVPVFTEEQNGDIGILYVGLSGLKTYMKARKELPYKRLRVHPDRAKSGPKYLTPKGAGSHVFIPPQVLLAYEKQQLIPTLVVTEGEFKAFKLSMHQLPALGLPGIGVSREKDEGGNLVLNTEIRRIIEVCQVRNVILLFDNDCLSVEYDPEKDLAKRPLSFFTAVKNFREATKPLNCDVYFAHLKADLTAKGIDDLLCSRPGAEEAIIADLLSFKQTATYFEVQNITDNSLKNLKSYFRIDSAETFYEEYEKIIENQRFRFMGAYYQHDGSKVVMLVSDEINNYIRVGDDYYEKIVKPDRTERLLPYLDKRRKQTIVDDHSPKAIAYIKKYKAFCLVPSHTDYQEVIHNCFNAYHRIVHQPQPGPVEHSLAMVRHIFGESHYEFGLDYLQLLYTRPEQLLPILLLQSKARNTGKSVFGQWLIEIYGANAAKLSNQDMESDFNSTYAERLLVVVDETSLSKKVTSEAIKKMSTEQGKIWVNAKGRQQYETDWIGKFIFCTNTENTSLYIGKGETRYFVRSVSPPAKDDPDMNDNLLEEIPAFLHFLSQRTLHYPRRGRMYFDFSVYQTPELTGAVAANLSVTEKAIRQLLSDSFAMFEDQDELLFTASDLASELKGQSQFIDTSGIIHCLKQEWDFESPKQTRYDYFSVQLARTSQDAMVYIQPRNGRPYKFSRKEYGQE